MLGWELSGGVRYVDMRVYVGIAWMYMVEMGVSGRRVGWYQGWAQLVDECCGKRWGFTIGIYRARVSGSGRGNTTLVKIITAANFMIANMHYKKVYKKTIE